ncbi:hypothetical protein [Mesobacillus selenatarsenatis]|uniref:Uncharacterized protein n=1 Tax=Mesobacillus selenatarsenatis (strain DSM 18680 / JCM 14380 / FERM P-15431 / SF-1) TaxID=1321606 RepID=A0A0A8X935_MESS1|nr:hypothetical protein [Mesobacillus selenatarsenatis]GAM14681.1 hypothetical protein SAMD00020551_2834 [Mesobacillus selenatarsenatis SF-1]
MSVYENLDLNEFVEKLVNATNTDKVKWQRVLKDKQMKLVDRSTNYTTIKDPFYSKNKQGEVVVVGKLEKKVYYEEDQYYYDDIYFLTFTDSFFNYPTTFSDQAEVSLSFQIELGKLHRLIQIKTNKIKEKIDNWFD